MTAAASAAVQAMMNLGGFVNSFWLKFLAMVTGENIIGGLICAMVAYFALAVIFAIRSHSPVERNRPVPRGRFQARHSISSANRLEPDGSAV